MQIRYKELSKQLNNEPNQPFYIPTQATTTRLGQQFRTPDNGCHIVGRCFAAQDILRIVRLVLCMVVLWKKSVLSLKYRIPRRNCAPFMWQLWRSCNFNFLFLRFMHLLRKSFILLPLWRNKRWKTSSAERYKLNYNCTVSTHPCLEFETSLTATRNLKLRSSH